VTARLRLVLAGGVLVAALAPARVRADAPPRVTAARTETHSAAAGLDRTLRAVVASSSTPAWIGYAVPGVIGHRACCGDGDEECRCRLEDGRGVSFSSRGDEGAADGPVALEDTDRKTVLFRAQGGRVEKIRVFSKSCALDAGGLPFHWLTEVEPRQSVEVLSAFVGEGGRDESEDDGRPARSAVAAIAMHADPAADAALDRFVAPDRPVSLRKQAAFWMGVARGRHGYEALDRIVRSDPSEAVREHAVFALSQSRVPEALEAMIRAAREDQTAHVRGKALFWLGQKAGRKAAAAITQAVAEDPETAVKEKAVFALSQMPRDEGVPRLIEVARHNPNPAVRKKAMFWLGQTGDPRALAFFEDVLKR
jgi:HEAT repeat protein